MTLFACITAPIVIKAQTTTKIIKQESQTINVVGTGITRTIEATGNENINIEGSNINVVVTGNCNTIKATGASIKVKAQGVKVIRIEGVDCGVTYKSSPNKNGRATSSIVGAGSYARKVK